MCKLQLVCELVSKLHFLWFASQKYLMNSLFIAYDNEVWCHLWYTLGSQDLFYFIGCVSFLSISTTSVERDWNDEILDFDLVFVR